MIVAGVTVLLGLALALFGPDVMANAGDAAGQTPEAARELPVTPTNLRAKTAHNSPQLAVDPTEERFVVTANRLDGPDFGCALHLSGDGGRHWVSADPVPELPEGADKCYGPEVAFGADGTLYYLFVGLRDEGNTPVGAYLTTSEDRGRSFSPPQQVLDEHRYMVRMALDRDTGRLHLVWLQALTDPPFGGLPTPPNPIMAAHSDDGGRSWSEPVQVNDPDRQRVVAPALALGPDGAVHVAYYDLRDDTRDYQGLEGPTWEGDWSLALATSTDAGETFEAHRTVDDAVVPPERVMLIFTMTPPALATDDDGHVYAAWHDARNDDWDVFLRRSPDAGDSWREPVRVNDDPVGNGAHQYMPQLAVADDGRVDMIFYDRRHNEENRGNDVSYTYSTDAGAGFADNKRLTQLHFDSRIGPRYAVPSAARMFEFGSRIALTAAPQRTLAAWTDTRHTGRGAPAQDVFATEVSFSEDAPAWPQPAGAGLVGLALIGLALRRTGWRPARSAPAAADDVTESVPSNDTPASPRADDSAGSGEPT